MSKINYVQSEDYYIPNLSVPSTKPIGRYGRHHCEYLKKYNRCRYSYLMITGKLFDYLREVDSEAVEEVNAILNASEQTAPDKAKDNIAWAPYMNSAKNSAEEIILNELIYR